eukprot:symbB.v1.2.028395.t1/scaffold3007.1/size65499/5
MLEHTKDSGGSSQLSRPKILFLRGLPWGKDEEDVKTFFSPIALRDVIFVNCSNGRPTGEVLSNNVFQLWYDPLTRMRGLYIFSVLRAAAAQCEKGEFWDSVQCLKCPMGRWTDTENTQGAVNCQACPPGRWSDQEGTQSPLDCFQCPTGRWAAAHGAAQEDVCIFCSPGRASSVLGSSTFETCEPCQPGNFSDSGAESCSPCYAGSWSNSIGATGNETVSCTPCDAGRFGAEAGKTDASLCLALRDVWLEKVTRHDKPLCIAMQWFLLALIVPNWITSCETLEDLSGDGGVLKRRLREGVGQALPRGESGSVVRATVRGPIAISPSGDVLDEDAGIMEVILGQGLISSGLDMAIASMREKEEAVIKLSLGKNGMVALIGMQATGKTTTLQHILWEAENPFFMEVSHDNVHQAIHNELRKRIWKLPWLLDGVRMDWGKTHKDVVTEVFVKVREKTQKPVRLGFDVAATKHAIDEPHVKYLCSDRHVSSALISSSEGLLMLSVGEPRLDKMLGRELPLSKSKAYLKALGEENISEEMLMKTPRTFEKLRKFSASANKETFCNEEMQTWVRAIKETNRQPFTNVKELYQKALNEPIDIDDIRAATSGKLATLGGADPKEAFIQQMVKTNIFRPRRDGGYELQFDCQHKAVKEVFDL